MNKIKIVGIKNLPTEETIEPVTDYAITLVASLDGIFQKSTQGDETEPVIYHLKADHIALIQKLGTTKEVKFEQGSSPSQRQRFAVLQWAKRKGEANPDKFYEEVIEKNIKAINGKDI